MKNSMKNAMFTFVLAMLATTGICLADIPGFVDFHVSTTDGTNWTVVKNLNDYDVPPVWQNENKDLYIDNEEVLANTKELWFEIEYTTEVPATLPLIELIDPESGVSLVGITTNGLNVTWQWHIIPQPAYEVISFPDTDIYNMVGIDKLEVGTYCTPEPATMSLLAIGGLAMLKRRRRK
jgi:hypothetical protein